MDSRRLLVIVGPTGVGKSEYAIRLAQAIGGEIVSIDSRYLYRGMDIGTAKPDIRLRQLVPHHLIDVADPDESWSLALFQQRVYEALEEIFSQSKIPLLVGGTGQYYRAILEGWQPPPVPPRPRLRECLERWLAKLEPVERQKRLALLDKGAAEIIDARNLRRVVRALEVVFSTGRPFSSQRKASPLPYPRLVIGLILPRAELYRRCDLRLQHMFEQGWVQEVESLLRKGYSPSLPSFSAIGYREIAAYLAGLLSMEQVVTQIRRRTRALIRRQANWFRIDDPDIHWFHASEQGYDEMLMTVWRWLRS
ncbi:MAG: tRNA (adenosine(37)-N6)-dimethylallyltransferase MiaA [Anaerolineales bacterium]|nr:tRNA (adenosine(37)-N6)-dimethylallyltransferase MiaA [Anaerolineales bacterium]MCS7248562.1 tRNA (adenosine(37)-N6)-dimethylallyltransferase MiaA [Anaerolineales bacterium]MDW8162375.1 tRNA (adenosine(37)-N6)-dimethylallyltransferase MiaA [Anaerolineales bacterium]MDW8447401.1 tRNA (adenosine(37)-N6)-dimethylallyltransferase MiaA [Anaerolineales bacterium]